MRITKRFENVERRDIIERSEKCLWTNYGKPGLEYLYKRGISKQTIKVFNLGYVPENEDHQLRNRIIMPLYDASGNAIAITSRLIRNPKESDVLPVHWHESYEKSFYVYGLNVSKHHMRDCGFVCCVEGQFDTMQMYNAGALNTIGLGGTNLSDIQLSDILRYCNRIVLILDNDENLSGQKGTDKIMKNFSNPFSETYLSSVELSGAKDPDEFIRKFGFEKLKQMIKIKIVELEKKDGQKV